MPFYFGSPYAPAAFWRYLEAYTPTHYLDTVGAGAAAWRNIVNIAARGQVTTLSNNAGATDYRMSINGGAWILFTLAAGEVVTKVVSFDTSIQIQHWRNNAVYSSCWVLAE